MSRVKEEARKVLDCRMDDVIEQTKRSSDVINVGLKIVFKAVKVDVTRGGGFFFSSFRLKFFPVGIRTEDRSENTPKL
jgi:hypothetical protein